MTVWWRWVHVGQGFLQVDRVERLQQHSTTSLAMLQTQNEEEEEEGSMRVNIGWTRDGELLTSGPYSIYTGLQVNWRMKLYTFKHLLHYVCHSVGSFINALF